MDKPALNRTLVAVLYAACALAVARLAFQWDADVGIVTFFALLLPLCFLMRWPHSPGLLVIGFTCMLAGKIVYALTLDPLKGPDEIHYFEQVQSFADLGSFYRYAWQDISANWLNMSAVPVFGLLYMPFYKGMQLENPLAVIALNTLLLLLVAQQAYRLGRDHFRFRLPDRSAPMFDKIVLLGLLVSPSFMFLSSVFAKDVTCALLGLYGALLLLRRKYIFFLLVLLYATGLRDYALVYTFGIYFVYRDRMKTALAVMLLSLLVVVWQTGVTGPVNAALLSVFFFLSPNPFNPENWAPDVVYRTLEAIWMLGALLLSAVVYLKAPESRRFYRISLVVLYMYACALILVGYLTITSRELDYGVGTIGDNMVRKKLPVLPLLYVYSAYTFVWLGRLLRPVRHERREAVCGEETSFAGLKRGSVSSP